LAPASLLVKCDRVQSIPVKLLTGDVDVSSATACAEAGAKGWHKNFVKWQSASRTQQRAGQALWSVDVLIAADDEVVAAFGESHKRKHKKAAEKAAAAEKKRKVDEFD